ncbi:MAG: hypothetical protein WD046_05275 [Paracoccaceae bacterium]
MKPLARFEALALMPRNQPRGLGLRIRQALPRAVLVPSSNRIAQLAALNAMEGNYVVIMPPDILPKADFGQVEPDALLLQAGYRIGWLARNAVTGALGASPCPQVWQRCDLIAYYNESLPDQGLPPCATMPLCHNTWAFNYASRPAFLAGFDHALGLMAQDDNKTALTVAASYGGDQPYADWWHLGALNAMVGAYQAMLEYEREKVAMAAGRKMQDRLVDLSRRANAALGLDIVRISRQNAAFFRQDRFAIAGLGYYRDLADIYAPLGAAGAVSAENWREAARWAWGSAADDRASSAG